MKHFYKKNRILIIFVLVTFLGLAIRYILGKDSWLWTLWSSIDVSFAVSLGIMAFMAYKELIKSEDEIEIHLEVPNRVINTRLSLLRKDCTRSEIQGVLGMIQKDSSKRYNVSYMKQRAFLQKLHQIQKGNDKRLIIYLSDQEVLQFDVKDDFIPKDKR